MRDRDIASVLAATILTLFGFAAVRSITAEPPVAFGMSNAVAATADPTTTTIVPEGIDPAVFRTLQANGDTWVLPTSEAKRQLPDAVVRVLEQHDAVLRVVEP